MTADGTLDTRELGLWLTFSRYANLVNDAVDSALSQRHDLGLTDYELLALLGRSESKRVRMSELAEHLVVSRSNLSHRVTRLENRGLVRRVDADRSGRGVDAALTRSGTALLRRASATHAEAAREVLVGRLNRKDRAELNRLLGSLLEAVDGA